MSSDPSARGRCPACHADGLVPIVYGMPSGDLLDDARRGRVVIGGCIIDPDQPDEQCIECGANVFEDGRFERPEW